MSHLKCTVGPYTRESNEIVAPNGQTLGVAYPTESISDALHFGEETRANAALFTASWRMLQALKWADAHIEFSERILGKVNGSAEVRREISDAVAAAEDY